MPGSAQLAGSVDAGAELRPEILHFSSSSHPGDSNVHSSAEQSHAALLGHSHTWTPSTGERQRLRDECREKAESKNSPYKKKIL